MNDYISKEAKLQATKEIVCAFIKSSVVKEGDDKQQLGTDSKAICKLFSDVYATIDKTVPNEDRKVGLGV